MPDRPFDATLTAPFFASPRYKRARYGWITDIGLLATLVAALMAFVSRDVTRVAEVLVFLSVLASARLVLRTDPRAWLYFVLIALALWMWSVDTFWHTVPEAADDPLDSLRNYVKVFFFMFAGWWLGGRERNAVVLLAAGMVGVVVRMYLTASPGDWASLLTGHRADFGYVNAQHVGVLLGSMAVGLVCFAPKFLYPATSNVWLRCGLVLLWVAMFTFTVMALSGTAVRQAWVGLIVASIVTFPAAGFLLWRRGWRRGVAVGGGVLLMGIIVFFQVHPLDGLWSRTQRDVQAVEAWVQTGSPEQLTSATVRLLEWHFAWEKIVERPILGYGGDSARVLIQDSSLPEKIRLGHGHVHNSYLDLWLAYGIFAPASLLLALVVLFQGVSRAYKDARISLSMTLFGVAWLTFFAVVNFFESYFNYHTGYYMLFVCGGALYGASLKPRAADQSASAALSRST